MITFTRSELEHILVGVFHNDATRLEHHQANRMGEFPPEIEGRRLDRWFEPKEIALHVARAKLGRTDFLFLPIAGCECGAPGERRGS